MAKRKKTGGRTRGVLNKTTIELRERIKSFLDENFETMQADFHKLEPIQKFTFYEKLIKYAVPTLQATDLIVSEDNNSNIRYDMLTTEELKTIVAICDKYNFND